MHRSIDSEAWYQTNHNYLKTVFDQLHNILQRYIDLANQEMNGETDTDQTSSQHSGFSLRGIGSSNAAPAALEQLCDRFELSEFESYLLSFCAATELDSRFSRLCTEIFDADYQYHPTFGLALSALPSPHWSALTPDRPLRYWELIQLDSGNSLINTSLVIDERILHYLTGIQTTDPVLAGLTELPLDAAQLMPSHQHLATKIESLWRISAACNSPPVVQLSGPEIEDKTRIAQVVSHNIEQRVCYLSCDRLPFKPVELTSFIRRLERECVLNDSFLLLNCDEVDPEEPQQRAAIVQLIEAIKGFVILTTRTPLQRLKRQVICFDVPKPHPQEQFIAWQTSITELKIQLNGQRTLIPDTAQLSKDLLELTAQFNLSTSAIRSACTTAIGQLTTHPAPTFKEAVWQSCRVQARPGLDGFAERIESKLSWEDLILPPLQKSCLKEMVAHVQHRAKVYETWGFAAKNRRGLGITALFSGPSGTGKTFAASVLANELSLDLYKIELSSVVSKYIGETEKHLQQIFDAAERGGVILLFDEADSIFGKRSEVNDSKDRYANLEVSYLLQRMESYPGLAILTTNLQSNLDPAFMRRLRFITQFSLPDATHRTEIWRRIFPPDTPTAGLNFNKLAQLNTPGGNIRIIALNAAFIAADVGEAVQMKHILKATQTEYEKLGKSLTSVEIAGWVEGID
jgi:hypothetical protein